MYVSVIIKQMNMPKFLHRTSFMTLCSYLMSLFSSTFSPVTLLQFDTRIFTAISLHEKITHWRTFCVLMFLLEVTGFLSCLASHILFQFFLLVQNSESVSSPVIIFANCLWLIMGIIFSNCSPDCSRTSF